MRVGIGYDVHQLVPDRKLILGGVEIPWEKGLLGHSDADVLIHAVMDAVLGAAGLGDIGRHFPDTDPEFEGADSLVLLKRVQHLVAERGYQTNNVDAVIIAQQPKLAPYMDIMQKNIATALEIAADRVNIKATTTETLGFEGRGEGIAVQAIASIL